MAPALLCSEVFTVLCNDRDGSEQRLTSAYIGSPTSIATPKWKNMTTRRATWWALQDSNLQPTDYESAALTIELRALCVACRVPISICRPPLRDPSRDGFLSSVIGIDPDVPFCKVACPDGRAASPATPESESDRNLRLLHRPLH